MTKKKDPSKTKSELLIELWKFRADYKGYDRSKGSLFNSWRAKVNTKKGKLAGFPEKWKTYEGFVEDVGEGWERGKILVRIDVKKPFSKDNVEWRNKGEEALCKLSKLEYNGETKTILEWCEQFNLNYNAVRQRFVKGKNFTKEQILFGKKLLYRGYVSDIHELTDSQKQADKISKIYSQYRNSDKKKGLENNIDREWLARIILEGRCEYCGDTRRLGLDRIDNSKGHTMDNVVVCCYDCNVARGNNFSYQEMKILGNTIRKIKEKRNADYRQGTEKQVRDINPER